MQDLGGDQTYSAEEVIWHAHHNTSTVTIAAISTNSTYEAVQSQLPCSPLAHLWSALALPLCVMLHKRPADPEDKR